MKLVVIAGIDVGTTTAIALLDENKRIVDSISKKNFSEREIISYISNKTHLVLLSTDKSKIPARIKKIAARLNLGVFAPKKDLPLEYKKRFYANRKLREILKNIHEFDAYIAAYYAIDQVRDIIIKTKKVTNDINKQATILRKYFRNLKKEPVTIYRELFENKKRNTIEKNKDINNNKEIKRRIKEEGGRAKSIKIVVKRVSKEDRIIKDRLSELTKLLSRYITALDIISESILKKKTEELIPKISYVEKKKISIKRVFLDDSNYIDRVYKYREIFILRDKFEQIKEKMYSKKVYLVDEYIDVITFIIPKKYEEIALNDNKENISEVKRKIKEIIRKYRYCKM
ncbi:MAG TPA: DUF460 domain-containing protein [Candidatus Nanopusillus sp.]|nr:DUF460 domain-containing protein [Candidatus Nanopusillus sp.]